MLCLEEGPPSPIWNITSIVLCWVSTLPDMKYHLNCSVLRKECPPPWYEIPPQMFCGEECSPSQIWNTTSVSCYVWSVPPPQYKIPPQLFCLEVCPHSPLWNTTSNILYWVSPPPNMKYHLSCSVLSVPPPNMKYHLKCSVEESGCLWKRTTIKWWVGILTESCRLSP